MKKRILLTCLAVILLLSGCTGTRSPAGLEPLTFVVPRNWQELDSTPALEERISQIEQLVRENPYRGVANDFTVNHIGTQRSELTITWLAINRTGRPIRNISFDIVLLRDDIYSIPIELTESFIGIIPDQAATVFTLSLPAEEAFEYLLSLLNDVVDGAANMFLEDAVIEFADE